MRPQKVSVDVWKMICSTCSYLFLAFAAWVFLKLVNACFWLPQHLRDSEKLDELQLHDEGLPQEPDGKQQEAEAANTSEEGGDDKKNK